MTESGGAGGTRSFTSLAIVTVGLPARGKTYLARKITRYLNWLGYPSRIFNVGNVRRQEVGAFKGKNKVHTVYVT